MWDSAGSIRCIQLASRTASRASGHRVNWSFPLSLGLGDDVRGEEGRRAIRCRIIDPIGSIGRKSSVDKA